MIASPGPIPAWSTLLLTSSLVSSIASFSTFLGSPSALIARRARAGLALCAPPAIVGVSGTRASPPFGRSPVTGAALCAAVRAGGTAATARPAGPGPGPTRGPGSGRPGPGRDDPARGPRSDAPQ